MARFILEYDVSLERETKMWILENVNASMVCPNGNSTQFCLVDVLDKLKGDVWIDPLDYIQLNKLSEEGVDYIEIC